MAEASQRRVVRSYVLVGAVLPGVLWLANVVLQLVALPHLPATVATHWDASGAPNAYGPPWVLALVTGLIGLVVPGTLFAVSLPGLLRGHRGLVFRLLGAIGLGVAGFLTAAGISSTLANLRAADGGSAHAGGSWWVLLAGLALGLIGWFAQPSQGGLPFSAPIAPTSPAAPVGETASGALPRAWTATTALPRGAVVPIVAALLLVGLITVDAWFTGGGGAVAWITTIAFVLLLVASATLAAYHVRVDAGGFIVVSALGLPRFRIPLDDIARVRTVQVEPLRDFGGWGLRGLPGRLGVVPRRGDGIEVTRLDGRRLTVTAPDASTGAAVLTSLVAERRAAS
ncbi:MAG: DUF1648 domain-containing protein [Microbacterium sp.]|jgi:Protein of unknown function (DUF1648)|uniref:DUF1648 domain-containing protein n=2 Tax=Microbacterium ginsengisoli TaxID=400772 RepID=A0A0F0LRK9_9MICO|nr:MULTISPECIES: DUF1648 domain-containing protein [Microbacterium]MAL07537.1 DUF1648 domain-containing protein [Microbacterium sp.]KJL34900.1 hypothetical protein RR49_02791 [Microbacterium ginsengisoli]KJL35015.1 hypothetical protein RR49_02910 [Microbacterium ginsengisoli]MBN9207708.1 DUF1648 domain-containing protein [Microbacterium ginsengisoli]ODU77808.1 MAG: hypothetical protein ABT08_05695 [Microbacterium sp. SCN 71-21]